MNADHKSQVLKRTLIDRFALDDQRLAGLEGLGEFASKTSNEASFQLLSPPSLKLGTKDWSTFKSAFESFKFSKLNFGLYTLIFLGQV